MSQRTKIEVAQKTSRTWAYKTKDAELAINEINYLTAACEAPQAQGIEFQSAVRNLSFLELC